MTDRQALEHILLVAYHRLNDNPIELAKLLAMDLDEIIDQPKEKYIVKTWVLNIRTGPGVQHDIVGKLRKGDIVEVLETEQDLVQAWARIGPSKWACINKVGQVYMLPK